jgi:acyl carrier protein
VSQGIDARLTRIIEAIFGATVAQEILEKSTRGHPAWDSIAHLNLVMAIEQEFGVRFTPEEAGMTTTLDALREILQLKSSA